MLPQRDSPLDRPVPSERCTSSNFYDKRYRLRRSKESFKSSHFGEESNPLPFARRLRISIFSVSWVPHPAVCERRWFKLNFASSPSRLRDQLLEPRFPRCNKFPTTMYSDALAHQGLGKSISNTLERSCTRSRTISLPSTETSKSRTSKSAGRLSSRFSVPLAKSTRHSSRR